MNNDANHEFLSQMIPQFIMTVLDIRGGNSHTSFVSENFNISGYSKPVGFSVLFTYELNCNEQLNDSSIYYEVFPANYRMKFWQFLGFKIKIILRSLMIVSAIVLLIHSMNYVNIYVKYSLLLFSLLVNTSWVIRIILFTLLATDDFSEILLIRHRGYVKYRIEIYLGCFFILNLYSVYSVSTRILPMIGFFIFVAKRGFDYLLKISLIYDMLLNISKTTETLTAITGNYHSEVIYLFVNFSSRRVNN